MNIMPVSEKNENNTFGGTVYLKGEWPQELKKQFLKSSHVKELASGRDVFVKISSTPAYDSFHWWNEPLYSIKVNIYKENSLFNRLKYALNIGRTGYLTQNPHSENGIAKRFDDFHFDYLKQQLGIK